MSSRLGCAAALLGAALPLGAAAQEAGPELAVPTQTANTQTAPAVASDVSGNFVVVWHSVGPDGSGPGIFGRRFATSGAPQGPEFQVNTYTAGAQTAPAAAADAAGNFVVAWTSAGQDGSGSGVFARRFDASGAPAGSEFRVNAYTTGDQLDPAVAMDVDGGFVVAWTGAGQDGSGSGVFAQRFDAAGVPQGAELAVNTYVTGDQSTPAVSAAADGRFVVVWTSSGQDGSAAGIVGRRFDASGAPLGGEFLANDVTSLAQSLPAVAVAPDGRFVVAWTSDGEDGSGLGVFARRFDALGAAQGGDVAVNTYTSGAQSAPALACASDGSFVVVWQGSAQDGSGYGVFGRRFDAAGTAASGDFPVNAYTTADQRLASAASNADGDFLVAWASDGQDGSLDGVFARRYGDLIFQDDFESGGLSRWSSSSADGGDLSVSAPSALAGTGEGLGAFVDDVNPLFVRDDSPDAELRYRARFYFDPGDIDPGEAAGKRRIRILIAFNADSQRVITLVLRRLGGVYAVMARVRRDDGTRADTGFFTVAPGEHLVELDWQRAAAPGSGDGRFELRLDDAPVSTLTGIDNGAAAVEFVRLGVMSVKAALAGGTMAFDQFESRRQRAIGPEPPACIAAPESCFNGADDDCDGLADCADPECNPVAECVPDPAAFTLGARVDDASSCPSGYDGAGDLIHQGLVVPASCTGCSCTPSLDCQASFGSIIGACPGVPASTVQVGATCTALAGFNTGKVRVGAMNAVKGCAPSGTPLPAPTSWTSDARFCPALSAGGGCGAGFTCAPRTLDETYCVAAAGVQSCPAGYSPDGGTWYTGLTDGRTCGAQCQCSSPVGGGCGTSSLSAHGSAGCTGGFDTLLPGDFCAASTYMSARVRLQGQTLPSCTSTNTVAGSVVPTGAQTLCCFSP